MAFELPIRSTKRLRAIDIGGMETFDHATNLDLDNSHLNLLDPNREHDTAKADQGKDERAEREASRLETFEHFTTAQGELDVIIDLVGNLEVGRHLDFRIMTNKPRNINAIQDLALDSMVRFGKRQASLESIATKLKQGAQALKSAANRDNAFFDAVVRLQRFWKIRLNPLVAEFSDSPYSVDLSLIEGSQAHENLIGLSSTTLVPLIKDPVSGSLMVNEDEVSISESTMLGRKKVAVGGRAVHGRLLALQHRLLWRLATTVLEQEAHLGSLSSNFMYSLAEKTLAHVISQDASVQLSALRALILEHLTSCRLPNATHSDHPRPRVPCMSQLYLLPELGSWIRHINFRDSYYRSLDTQAHVLRRVRLQWLPTNHPFTSALNICLASDHKLLLVIQESTAEIEGFSDPSGTISRWPREGCVSLPNIDVRLIGSLFGLA